MDRLSASLPINGLTWARAEVLNGPERRRRWTLDHRGLPRRALQCRHTLASGPQGLALHGAGQVGIPRRRRRLGVP